jgi:hypothetical protein
MIVTCSGSIIATSTSTITTLRPHADRPQSRVQEAVQRVARDRLLLEDLHEVVEFEAVRPQVARQRLPVAHQRGEQDERKRREEADRERDQQAVLGDREQQLLAPARPGTDDGGGSDRRCGRGARHQRASPW